MAKRKARSKSKQEPGKTVTLQMTTFSVSPQLTMAERDALRLPEPEHTPEVDALITAVAALRGDKRYEFQSRYLNSQTCFQHIIEKMELAERELEALRAKLGRKKNEERQELRYKIVELRKPEDGAKPLSFGQIAQRLNNEGHRTTTGAKFAANTVRVLYEKEKAKRRLKLVATEYITLPRELFDRPRT